MKKGRQDRIAETLTINQSEGAGERITLHPLSPTNKGMQRKGEGNLIK